MTCLYAIFLSLLSVVWDSWNRHLWFFSLFLLFRTVWLAPTRVADNAISQLTDSVFTPMDLFRFVRTPLVVFFQYRLIYTRSFIFIIAQKSVLAGYTRVFEFGLIARLQERLAVGSQFLHCLQLCSDLVKIHARPGGLINMWDWTDWGSAKCVLWWLYDKANERVMGLTP